MSTAQSSTPAPRVLSFTQAQRLVQEYASQLEGTAPETRPILDGVGLVLAEDLLADRDFPPFPRATRDGYAVRAADVAFAPSRLRCVGEIKAGASGEQANVVIHAGETAEIMTGAPVPKGADAVVMVEHTEQHGGEVAIHRGIQKGENVVSAGAEACQGAVMVARGTRVSHTTVAVAAAVGRAEFSVHARPRVAILATGDELVDIRLPPGPNQIRNSNSYSLAAQVYAHGGEPVILPIASDQPEKIGLLVRKGLESDLLLLSGGVSMGKYDLVEQVLESFAARFFFTGVAIQPGKPVVFGELRIDDRARPFFGLPGNPVSTMVTFQLFVRPVLDGLSGSRLGSLPFVQAKLKSEFRTKTGLTRFLPAALGGTQQQPEVEPIRWQGSGDLMAISHSNCYLVVPPDRERFAAGESVTVLLF